MKTFPVFYYLTFVGEIPVLQGFNSPRVLMWKDKAWVRNAYPRRSAKGNRGKDYTVFPTYLAVNNPRTFRRKLRSAARALTPDVPSGALFVWIALSSDNIDCMWGLALDTRHSSRRIQEHLGGAPEHYPTTITLR